MLQGDRKAMKRGRFNKVEGSKGTSLVKSYYCVLLGGGNGWDGPHGRRFGKPKQVEGNLSLNRLLLRKVF